MKKEHIVSDCCSAPVEVTGKTTLYFICTKCKQACDGIQYINTKKKQKKERKHELSINN